MRIRFGSFLLDTDARQLTQDDREIHLAPKAFDLLTALIDARPKALSKEVLQDQLWPGTFVVEANLSNLVAEIRQALGDSGRKHALIRTVHRFGYAFCGDAVTAAAPARAVGLLLCWIEWGKHRYRLAAGEHIIGRAEDASVRLDAQTVSRRHARLVVSSTHVTLEDLDSKNGTFRGNDRVGPPVKLVDGDLIRIGSLSVTFGLEGPESTISYSQSARLID